MTVSDAKGFGKQEARRQYVLGPVARRMLARVTDAIVDSCRTGRIGDGKIFVTAISEAVRIRAAERGEDALS